jgi:adenylate cyclase class 2
MPIQQEIEIKFVLDDPASMRASLLALGAAPHGRCFENNLRLDDLAHTLTERHIVLRLREEERPESHITRLTVKTPIEAVDKSLSHRNEIELEVGDGSAMLAALDVLGYRPYWRYEKRRETFSWHEVEAVIDEMPFGWFLEIEGSSEGIAELAGSLGLDLADGLAISYARIFDNVCRALKRDIGNLTFDAFRGIKVDPWMYRESEK